MRVIACAAADGGGGQKVSACMEVITLHLSRALLPGYRFVAGFAWDPCAVGSTTTTPER
jgi:hypothetical protein